MLPVPYILYIMYLQCKVPIVLLQIPSLDQPCVLASARLTMWLPLKPPFEATCRTKQPNKWCLAVQCTTGWCHGNNPGFFGAWFQFHSGDVISLQRTNHCWSYLGSKSLVNRCWCFLPDEHHIFQRCFSSARQLPKKSAWPTAHADLHLRSMDTAKQQMSHALLVLTG